MKLKTKIFQRRGKKKRVNIKIQAKVVRISKRRLKIYLRSLGFLFLTNNFWVT